MKLAFPLHCDGAGACAAVIVDDSFACEVDLRTVDKSEVVDIEDFTVIVGWCTVGGPNGIGDFGRVGIELIAALDEGLGKE